MTYVTHDESAFVPPVEVDGSSMPGFVESGNTVIG